MYAPKSATKKKSSPQTEDTKIKNRYYEHDCQSCLQSTSENNAVINNVTQEANENLEQKVNENRHKDVNDDKNTPKKDVEIVKNNE